MNVSVILKDGRAFLSGLLTKKVRREMAFPKLITCCCLLVLLMNSSSVSGQKKEHNSESKRTQNQSQVKSLNLPGLDNVFQIDRQIYSGSGPAEQRSFDALKKLGVKTVISVDGTEPHLKMAQQAGLRYIHIPIGYDGVSHDAGLSFARAARDLQGSIYIHCHHGRHRGPTATAVVGICRGTFTRQQAVDFLKLAGTSRSYAGLWRDVRNFKVPPADAVLPKLLETTPVSPLVKAMSQISHHFEYLDQMQTRNQQPQIRQKNLDSLVLLREEFREAARKHAVDYDERFKKWMLESATQVKALEKSFDDNEQKQIASGLKTLKAQCKQCHSAYRD